jgi:hypothetical protein
MAFLFESTFGPAAVKRTELETDHWSTSDVRGYECGRYTYSPLFVRFITYHSKNSTGFYEYKQYFLEEVWRFWKLIERALHGWGEGQDAWTRCGVVWGQVVIRAMNCKYRVKREIQPDGTQSNWWDDVIFSLELIYECSRHLASGGEQIKPQGQLS